mmetsp:Transcript_41209/g.76638  ORF Transcript_41209/g.76638 Transcript_41209/m.76638 type:complete len:207 (-) Transcript_41209:80-700(-)
MARALFLTFLGLAGVEAASNCAKQAGCFNLQGGDQLRPILEGTQNWLANDGTCMFGHVAKGMECKTGAACGYTYYECECISREAAAQNAAGAKTARIAFGGAAAGIAACIWICVAITKMSRRDSAKIAPWSAPRSIGATRFNAICVEGQGPVVVDEVAQKSQTKRWDCLTVMLLGLLPGVLIIAGIAIMAQGVSINEKEYFNGCKI